VNGSVAARQDGAGRPLVGKVQPRRTVLFLERNVDGTIGGSYRSLLYLVKLLPRDRWRPIAVFYRDHELVEAYRKSGCLVLIMDFPPTVNLMNRFAWVQRVPLGRVSLLAVQKGMNLARGAVPLLFSYLSLLRREKVDIVHLNNGVMSATELLVASRMLGLITVVHQRGIGPLPTSFRFVRRLIDHVICVSDAARLNLVRQGLQADRGTTVHNGIEPDEFKSSITRDQVDVRRSLGIAAEALVIGNAGMIRGWKGQHVLVQAMARLHGRYPNAYCVLVGGISDTRDDDGEYLRGLKAFVEDHGLSKHVLFTGYQSRVADYVQIFDVMVHTSIDPEPFSRSVLEGMTLGRAMVATRTGGTPEAIEDGVSGLLVPPNDSDAMADAIERLLQSQTLRRSLGLAAARRIRDRFAIESNVASTADVYERLLHDR
jgi:glycosyltransferase involved in cell wall biosynthesis